MTKSNHWYQRYRPWRRYCEVGAWVLIYTASAVLNSMTTAMDVQRLGLTYSGWEPAVWEVTSAVAFLLLLPLLLWLTRRVPLQWRNWRYVLPLYLFASVVYSLMHVFLMVSMRQGVYFLVGTTYDFGPWPSGLAYEYLKDGRTFLASVLIIESYRFVLRRWQGEARLLDNPDAPSDDRHPESHNRPERFLVKMLGKEFLVPAEEIQWAKAAGNYINLRVGNREYPLRTTMTRLVEQLDPERFVQVHRSWLINLEQISAIEPQGSGDARLLMRDGGVVPCSRRYRDAVRGALERK